jgi:putative colanic acid biosynthesis UDP-glucose lipid carrier transferase
MMQLPSTDGVVSGALPAPLLERSAAPQPLPPSDALHAKSVRSGTLEPAAVTLIRHCALPVLVVAVLLASVCAFGRSLTSEYLAAGLAAFFISSQILTELDLRRDAMHPGAGRLSISRTLLEWSCVVAVLCFLAVSLKLTDRFSRDVFVAWLLLTPPALLLGRPVIARLARRIATANPLTQRYIIIGANEVGVELARRVEQSAHAGRFFGFFDHRNVERLCKTTHAHLAGHGRDVADYVRRHSISAVYIALPISNAPRIADLLADLRDTTASVYFVPNIFAFDLVQARYIEINGMPVLSICDSPLQGMSGAWKRALDLALAFAALVLTWPVLLAIAVAIKQSSPGPVLFKQRRYGLNGEEILVFKFRTMTVCEDGPVITQATAHDRRVTPVGAFLRRTSLDELPQILNVLGGDMSFVGPRPHAVAHNEEYRKLISGYMIRHKVRPGITGWAQVHGLRGETSTVDKMRQRVQYDLDYLKNWSLWLDLKIIMKTALTLLRDSNAY